MDIELTLVSTFRTLLISIVWILLLCILIFYAIIVYHIPFYSVILIVIAGGFLLYLLLKTFARFTETINVTDEYIKVGDRPSIAWDSIKTLEFSNTGLLVGLIFRTETEIIRIIGLTRGPEAEKFRLIKDHIFKVIESRNLSSEKSKILPYNFYASKGGIIGGIITLAICLATIGFGIYIMISTHKFTFKNIVSLIAISIVSISIISRLYISRNQNKKRSIN